MISQRTLKIGDRIIYCYEDGSVEYYNIDKNKLVKTNGSLNQGYRSITLKINGKHKLLLIHRLIAEAFILNENNLPCVDHINRNRSDNRVDNLRWVTKKQNADNQRSVDVSIETFGIRRCDHPKEYSASYRSKTVFLEAIKPSGSKTKYHFRSIDDSVYKILKPLSRRDRFYKYNEIHGNK